MPEIPAINETSSTPVPRTVVPVQVPNKPLVSLAVVREQINRSPEEDVTGVTVLVDLPVFGNQLGMEEKVFENASVQDGNLVALKFLAELFTLDTLLVDLIR